MNPGGSQSCALSASGCVLCGQLFSCCSVPPNCVTVVPGHFPFVSGHFPEHFSLVPSLASPDISICVSVNAYRCHGPLSGNIERIEGYVVYPSYSTDEAVCSPLPSYLCVHTGYLLVLVSYTKCLCVCVCGCVCVWVGVWIYECADAMQTSRQPREITRSKSGSSHPDRIARSRTKQDFHLDVCNQKRPQQQSAACGKHKGKEQGRLAGGGGGAKRGQNWAKQHKIHKGTALCFTVSGDM